MEGGVMESIAGRQSAPTGILEKASRREAYANPAHVELRSRSQ
jgi:hypothetical protein